jgi:hypothetical protein
VAKPAPNRTLYPDEMATMSCDATRRLYQGVPVPKTEDVAPQLAGKVAEYRRQTDPALAAGHQAAYPLPMSVARLLYRQGCPSSAGEVRLSVLGSHGSRLGEALAAGAYDAMEMDDWGLFGWLCLQLDLALGRCFDPVGDGAALRSQEGRTYQPAGGANRANVPLIPVLERYEWVVRSLIDQPERKCWPRCLIGYLGSLAPSFLPPSDLAGLTGATIAGSGAPAVPGDENLPLLRLLVGPSSAAWRGHVEIATELSAAASPFVRELLERRSCQDPSVAEAVFIPLEDMGPQQREELFLPLADLVSKEDDPGQFIPPPPPPAPPASAVLGEKGPLWMAPSDAQAAPMPLHRPRALVRAVCLWLAFALAVLVVSGLMYVAFRRLL